MDTANEQERAYLDTLAGALGLEPDLIRQLERQAAKEAG
ncbi:hypothetical protein [Methylomarinovum caldicuralii]